MQASTPLREQKAALNLLKLNTQHPTNGIINAGDTVLKWNSWPCENGTKKISELPTGYIIFYPKQNASIVVNKQPSIQNKRYAYMIYSEHSENAETGSLEELVGKICKCRYCQRLNNDNLSA